MANEDCSADTSLAKRGIEDRPEFRTSAAGHAAQDGQDGTGVAFSQCFFVKKAVLTVDQRTGLG